MSQWQYLTLGRYLETPISRGFDACNYCTEHFSLKRWVVIGCSRVGTCAHGRVPWTEPYYFTCIRR